MKVKVDITVVFKLLNRVCSECISKFPKLGFIYILVNFEGLHGTSNIISETKTR